MIVPLQSPLPVSLLKLDSTNLQLNKLAVECFLSEFTYHNLFMSMCIYCVNYVIFEEYKFCSCLDVHEIFILESKAEFCSSTKITMYRNNLNAHYYITFMCDCMAQIQVYYIRN